MADKTPTVFTVEMKNAGSGEVVLICICDSKETALASIGIHHDIEKYGEYVTCPKGFDYVITDMHLTTIRDHPTPLA